MAKRKSASTRSPSRKKSARPRATTKKKGSKGSAKATGNGANLGFETTLWAAADKLRGHMFVG